MNTKLKIFVIIGSASDQSFNEKLICQVLPTNIDIEVFNQLKELPHFDPNLTTTDVPPIIEEIRDKIEIADGVIFSTPEYIFSIPSGLKNLFEWCVATMVFTDKPVSIITASTSGDKCLEELQLILETLDADVRSSSNILIKGLKGKFDEKEELQKNVKEELENVISNFFQRFEVLRSE